MADETSKPKLAVVAEDLDEDEIEFKKLRRDLPGVKGVSAIGIVSITVSRKPEENEFFRTHPDFMPIIPIVNIEVGMERQFFAVTDNMVVALAGTHGLRSPPLHDRDPARCCADHPHQCRERQ
jgi:hypothetical protein